LRDLTAANPLETEAETYVLKALEETDPTHAGLSDAQKTLLGNVPDDVPHSFSAEHGAAAAAPTNKKEQETAPILPTHKRDKSTAEDLFDLTDDLKEMQTRRDSAIDDDASEGGQQMSSADAFAKNAAALRAAAFLMKRAKGNRRLAEEIISEETESEAGSDAKKTDEETPDDTKGAGRARRKSGSPGSKGRVQKVIGKAKRGAKSDFVDFEEFLKFRKATMIQYCKKALIWIVICTGVAAILFYLADNPPARTKSCISRCDR
jgi:hypothetical protein